MIRSFLKFVGALAIVLISATRAGATPVIYTFEAPNFTVGQATPLLGRAPNVNPGSFLADFTSPVVGAVQVDNFIANSLFSGQSLVVFDPLISDLVVTFNTAVYSLSVNFGINQLAANPPALFRLTTPVGVLSLAGANVGGTFQGGLLNFVSATPFLTARFSAFNPAGAPTQFAIDNLRLDTAAVPEPATIGLVLSGLALAARRRRQN